MARKKKDENKRPIESYEHRDKQRANNPPVGLVTPETDSEPGWGKGVCVSLYGRERLSIHHLG